MPVAPSSAKTKRKIYLFISVDPGEESPPKLDLGKAAVKEDPGEERPPKGDPAKVDPVEENEPNPEEN